MPGGKTMLTVAELGLVDSTEGENSDNPTPESQELAFSSNNQHKGVDLFASSDDDANDEPQEVDTDDRTGTPTPEAKKGPTTTKRKASRRKQGALKRFKTDPSNDATKTLIADTLFGCTDVVAIIFSFLDVRQLLRFVYISKEFKNLLTYEHIIRSTMFSGGFPMTNLERMIPPIRDRKIWFPSPIRLLRTLCGKRCERCYVQNRFVCYAFGLFWCKKCTNGSTKLFRKSKQWKEYLNHPRASLGPQKASNGKSNMYLILTPVKDAAGNPIGPLVTAHDLEIMAGESNNSTSTSATARMSAWMQKCDNHQPNSDGAAKAILKALEDSREDAANRRATVREGKKTTGRDTLGAGHRKKSDQVWVNLMDLLKDKDPDIAAVTKLDTKSWDEHQNQYRFEELSIATQILGPVFEAPSKYLPKKKKKLQPVVDRLVLVTGEKKLMDMYIQQIVDHCDHPGADRNVLSRSYRPHDFRYGFFHPDIRDILQEPFSEPQTLTHEFVQRLADQVQEIVHRQASGEAIIQKLEERLKGLPFMVDLWNRKWQSWAWSWAFTESYIEEILHHPLLKPADITEERLDALEEQLRAAMERKTRVHERMDQLLDPIANRYPEWHAKFQQWTWYSCKSRCHLHDCEAQLVLGEDGISGVEEMDDAQIEKLSNRLLAGIEKQLAQSRGILDFLT